MASQSVLQSHQSGPSAAACGKAAGGTTVTGLWAMEPQEVLTLCPRAPAMVRVSQGHIWATFSGPHSGPANAWGDLFLAPGQVLQVPESVLDTAPADAEVAARVFHRQEAGDD